MSALGRAWAQVMQFGKTRTSSACTYVSVIGSSSAVGTAVRKLVNDEVPAPRLDMTHPLTLLESEAGSYSVPTR
jgi:hypothetical protein